MDIRVIEGDLLRQDVEVIVNAWNRNIIPWWLLLPRGVSGGIKYGAGTGPFRELARKGPIPPGGAVETGPGRLPFRAIIHVAGLDMLWRTSEDVIRACVRSALALARDKGYRSLAFPLIGSGTGGFAPERALEVMLDEARRFGAFAGEVRIVKFRSTPNERGCYCGIREKDPSFYAARGVPPGYCGFCEKCGKPGHTRHFPGAVGYTGTWCDLHYRRLAILHPLGFPGGLIYFCLFFGALLLLNISGR